MSISGTAEIDEIHISRDRITLDQHKFVETAHKVKISSTCEAVYAV